MAEEKSLLGCVRTICAASDVATLSRKIVRRKLEEMFGVDPKAFDTKKKEINDLIIQVLAEPLDEEDGQENQTTANEQKTENDVSTSTPTKLPKLSKTDQKSPTQKPEKPIKKLKTSKKAKSSIDTESSAKSPKKPLSKSPKKSEKELKSPKKKKVSKKVKKSPKKKQKRSPKRADKSSDSESETSDDPAPKRQKVQINQKVKRQVSAKTAQKHSNRLLKLKSLAKVAGISVRGYSTKDTRDAISFLEDKLTEKNIDFSVPITKSVLEKVKNETAWRKEMSAMDTSNIIDGGSRRSRAKVSYVYSQKIEGLSSESESSDNEEPEKASDDESAHGGSPEASDDAMEEDVQSEQSSSGNETEESAFSEPEYDESD